MSSVLEAVRGAIAARIADAAVDVTCEGGHFRIHVTSAAFAGLGTLERHRLVLSAIKDLMAGDNAPVHAVDELITKTP
jgi:stress-induced morphogen